MHLFMSEFVLLENVIKWCFTYQNLRFKNQIFLIIVKFCTFFVFQPILNALLKFNRNTYLRISTHKYLPHIYLFFLKSKVKTN